MIANMNPVRKARDPHAARDPRKLPSSRRVATSPERPKTTWMNSTKLTRSMLATKIKLGWRIASRILYGKVVQSRTLLTAKREPRISASNATPSYPVDYQSVWDTSCAEHCTTRFSLAHQASNQLSKAGYWPSRRCGNWSQVMKSLNFSPGSLAMLARICLNLLVVRRAVPGRNTCPRYSYPRTLHSMTSFCQTTTFNYWFGLNFSEHWRLSWYSM